MNAITPSDNAITPSDNAITPSDDRGQLTAVAVVALTTLVFVLESRFDNTWANGVHLVYTVAAAAGVLVLASQTRIEGDRPTGWQSVLYVASFALVLLALTRVARVLGSDNPFGATGTLFWMGLILVGVAGWFATQKLSGISALLATVTIVLVAITFVDWAFSPDGPSTFRWIFLLLAVGFGAAGVAAQEEPRRSVALVNAAGVALLGLAVTFALTAFAGAVTPFGGGTSAASVNTGTGWEIILIVGAFALLAYAALKHASGPGYLGVANLIAFVAIAARPGEDGASLIGWPLVLILVTGALLAAALGRSDAST
jgi:hypothetical protein